MAAWLQSWSITRNRKSPNIRSTTGRIPVIAAPTARGRIPLRSTGLDYNTDDNFDLNADGVDDLILDYYSHQKYFIVQFTGPVYQEWKLRGNFQEGQTIAENLNEEQLHKRSFRFQRLFVAGVYRFGSNPFGAGDDVKKEPDPESKK